MIDELRAWIEERRAWNCAEDIASQPEAAGYEEALNDLETWLRGVIARQHWGGGQDCDCDDCSALGPEGLRAALATQPGEEGVSEARIAELAAEAEAGYDVDELIARRPLKREGEIEGVRAVDKGADAE